MVTTEKEDTEGKNLKDPTAGSSTKNPEVHDEKDSTKATKVEAGRQSSQVVKIEDTPAQE